MRTETIKHQRYAIVVGIENQALRGAELEASLLELCRLAAVLNIRVTKTITQKRSGAAASRFLGRGKLSELTQLVKSAQQAEPWPPETDDDTVAPPPVDLILINAAIHAGQQRRLERELGLEVVDRSAVVLEIFQRYASTPAARLALEIARLEHTGPRLRDDETRAGRQQGGGGRGSRGHSHVELAKERIHARIAQLRRELAQHESTAPGAHRDSPTPHVALVGYTNAGKSSLMRALTGADVFVADRLFATLGTTARAMHPKSSPPIVVSDSVGFIRDLPHALLAPFRSTLAQVENADLLVVVVDAADHSLPVHLQVTRSTLAEVGAGDTPSLLVLNKIDLVSDADRQRLRQQLPEALQISALEPGDIAQLRAAIQERISSTLSAASLTVPYALGRLLAEVRARAVILNERPAGKSVRLTLRASTASLGQWREALRRHGQEHRGDGSAAADPDDTPADGSKPAA